MNKKQIDFIQATNNAYFGFLNEVATYVIQMNEGKDRTFINLQMQKLAIKIDAINKKIADYEL